MSLIRFRDYDLNLLLVLHVLLEENNVTRAARRLALTQSATSRALGRLRDQLGDELLVRSGSSMVPTPRAIALKRRLGPVLDELGELLRLAPDVDPRTLRREFRIATADHPIAVLVPELRAHLREHAPGVSVRIDAIDERFSARLASGELDLVVCPRRSSGLGIVWGPVFTDRFVTIARRDHPRIGDALTMADFVREGHVVVAPEPAAAAGIVDRALAAEGRARAVLVRVPSFLVAPLIVAESDLIASVPERILRGDPGARGVRAFAPPVPLPGLTLAMGWHERMRRDPEHTWFRRRLALAAGTA